jgi:DNA polymerase-3 subunit beta
MEITADRKLLAEAVAGATRVLERRNTIPILANALFSASAGKLLVRATDLDIERKEIVNVQVVSPGGTTVPAFVLSDILRKMSAAEVTLRESKAGVLEVLGGRSRFQLQTLPDTDFPDITTGNMKADLRISGANLVKALSEVEFAISSEEVRYYLNGVFMHRIESDSGQHLRFVSTDGHRLARHQISYPSLPDMPGIIIPRKTVRELHEIGRRAGAEEIELRISDTKIVVAHGAVTITSKLIDGTFPDYGRVIPSDEGRAILRVKAGELAEMIDRVATVSSERGRAVKLTMADDRVVAEVINPDSGTATDELPAQWNGLPLTIGFNSAYALEILKIAGDQEIEIHMGDAGAPATLRRPGDPTSLFVLMPMRV